jgi:hypothetical protein
LPFIQFPSLQGISVSASPLCKSRFLGFVFPQRNKNGICFSPGIPLLPPTHSPAQGTTPPPTAPPPARPGGTGEGGGTGAADATGGAKLETKVETKLEAKTEEKAIVAEAKAGEKTLLKVGGKYATKAVPFVGIGAAVYFTAEDVGKGNYGMAVVDAAEGVPGLGDIVLAGELGVRGSAWAIEKWSNFVANWAVSINQQIRELDRMSGQ